MKLKFLEKRLRRRFSRIEAAKVFSDLTIAHGPFRGMRYPDLTAVGGTLFPRLLGCYERELHDVIEQACGRDYSHVVDVGCAEGYYAVGLAMRLQSATVYAFDTDDRARQQCAKMAALNGVADRVIIGEFCSPESLIDLPLGERALIVSDCEGYEKYLFTADAVTALAGHDVLIETHDVFDITISTLLRRRFAETHDNQVITSVDDVQKALYYDYPELAPYDLNQRKFLLGEHRAAIMEWFFLSSRNA